jgi:two-component system KDP operon response regulator KdpE
LQIGLESGGFKVVSAETGRQGIEQIAMARPEIVLLDLGLPDMDGLEVLKRIREWSMLPIIILSVRNSEQDIISALDAGANDYLSKPFHTGELLARVRVALRQKQSPDEETELSFGEVSIDFSARIVKRRGEIVKLTATEYALFALLAHNAGKVVTHSYILKEIWGPTFVEESQYLRVYVAQLRRKLEQNPGSPTLIVTESGVGYRLVESE